MRSKELPAEHRDRIVWRHRSGEGSIMLQWKKFGTTRTFPRAGRMAKLCYQGRRAWVREMTKNLMVTLAEVQRSYVEIG